MPESDASHQRAARFSLRGAPLAAEDSTPKIASNFVTRSPFLVRT